MLVAPLGIQNVLLPPLNIYYMHICFVLPPFKPSTVEHFMFRETFF